MYCKKNQVTIFMDRLQIFVTVETKFSSLQLLTNDTFFSIKKNDTIFFFENSMGLFSDSTKPALRRD